MDNFNSLIVYVTPGPEGTLDLDGGTSILDGYDEDGIVVNLAEWGWHAGNLDKLLRGGQSQKPQMHTPMFFRGAATFSNVDDAKNDYLAEPEVETTHDPDEIEHVPFGMVIPVWDDRGSPRLMSATVILFWQELM